MDVRNFLQLQRSFECDRVIDAAPEVEEIVRARVFPRDALDVRLGRENRLDLRGYRERRLQKFLSSNAAHGGPPRARRVTVASPSGGETSGATLSPRKKGHLKWRPLVPRKR